MDAAREWPKILGFDTGATVSEKAVEQNYRRLAKKYHPDAGGTDEDMKQLNLAKQLALKWITTERERLARAEIVASQAQSLGALQQMMAQQYAAAQQNAYSQWMGGVCGAANAYSAATTTKAKEPEQPKKNTWREKLRSWFR